MFDEQHAATALAEPPSEVTSPEGTPFDRETLHDFIRSCLRHPAVSDEVTRLLNEHVADGNITAAEVATRLGPILDDALATASDKEWSMIAGQFIADAECALGVRPWPVLPDDDRAQAGAMQRRLHGSPLSGEEMLARARELRAEAQQSDVLGVREAALALADRYELAATRRKL